MDYSPRTIPEQTSPHLLASEPLATPVTNNILSILSVFILRFSSPTKQLFSYYCRRTFHASHCCSPPYPLIRRFTQLRISCVVFSQDPRPVEILNPGSDHSFGLFRSFLLDLALTVFFPLFVLLPVPSTSFRGKTNLPCMLVRQTSERASERAFHVLDDPHGIVSRSRGRVGVRQTAERAHRKR